MNFIFKSFLLITILLLSSIVYADELDEIDSILLDVIKRNGIYANLEKNRQNFRQKSSSQSSHNSEIIESKECLPDSSRKEWQYFGPDYYRSRIFISNGWRRIPIERGLRVVNSDNTCEITIMSGITYGETAEEISSKLMFDLNFENVKIGKFNNSNIFYTFQGISRGVKSTISVFIDKKVFTIILVAGDINKSKEILKTLSR